MVNWTLSNTTLTTAGGNDVTRQFIAAYNNQVAFNHVLNQVISGCQGAPDYLASFSHIEPVNIPKVGALLELTATPEQKRSIGFPQ